MPVAIYVRVSTEEQRERQSIATQREFAEKYCDLHKLNVTQVYSDNGVSGTVPIENRPEGQRILADARQGRFGQLLIYKLAPAGPRYSDHSQHSGRAGASRSSGSIYDRGVRYRNGQWAAYANPAVRVRRHEREMIRERSIAGTKRLAQAGAWLGGIVPFGYRKEGERREARLAIADSEPLASGMSEAEIVRHIYRMAGVDRLSCRVIAERLNAMSVPCVYTRDDRLLLRGKRRQRTSGIWRAGRIRNLIVSPTYKGFHEYGKRSCSTEKAVVTRQVPAIVTEELWSKAQETLADNFLFGARNAKNRYLLRGLMKCSRCALTFIGTCQKRPSGRVEFYYRCNGKHSAPQIFGAGAKRCSSKDVNGAQLEALIWKDVERFLSDPGEVLGTLASSLSEEASEGHSFARTPGQTSLALSQKQEERNRILALYRRGRIGEDDFEKQLKEIESEEEILRRERARGAQAQNAQLLRETVITAEDLLRQLRERLGQGISWELKRQLIETLVYSVKIDTVESESGREAIVHVRYRFYPFSSDCTGTRASFNCTIEKTYRLLSRRAS